MQGLELRERIEASAVVRSLIRAGYTDIGSVRKADIEELIEIEYVGPKRANRIKEVFKAKEGVSKTKEAQPANQTGSELPQEALFDLPIFHNPMRKSLL